MKTVGAYLRTIRKEKDLSLSQVFENTGITNSRLSRIETGATEFPPAQDLRILAEYYGINILELFILAGYLEEDECGYTSPFENVEKLSEDEMDHIQHQINYLLKHERRA